ncbi:YbaB/EbfC family nucleoid-associated protein [Nocardia halotolerans]|uniref:YbaB/EbfC family nucleoid-associated protein n=1 Tax=Nocardia halotolerans TaxID=1755878 RepID=A0ABV8VQQ4_9NOCA
MSTHDIDGMRARNEALRDQVDSLMRSYTEQRDKLAEVHRQQAAERVSAWSGDNLVEVVTNAAGIPIEVRVEPEAFKRSTPAKLAQSMLEASQICARLAAERSQQTLAPFLNTGSDLPDLSDLVPGAPSIRGLVESMIPKPPEQAPQPQAPSDGSHDDEEEDDYFRNQRYLGGR